MAYTTPTTYSTGDLITAAQLNAQLSENMTFMKDRIGEFAYIKTTSETIMPAGTGWNTRVLDSVVTWDSENSGTSISWLGLATNKFTLSAGTYLIEVECLVAVDGDEFGIRIYNDDTSTTEMVSMVHASNDNIQIPVRIPPHILAPASSTGYYLQSRAENPRTTNFEQNLADMPSKYQTYLRILRIA